MTVAIVATHIYVLWLLAEGVYSHRQGGITGTCADRGSRTLQRGALLFGAPVGLIVGFSRIAEFQAGRNLAVLAGPLLMLSGIIIRVVAMLTLRGYYTPQVMISENHRLITAGIYGFVRHPAYLGYLMIHLGLGLSFFNGLTILAVFAPVLVAVLYRINVEDEALTRSLGSAYASYAKTTKRLIPKVY